MLFILLVCPKNTDLCLLLAQVGGVAHLFVTLNLALNLALMCTSSTCLSKLPPAAKSDLIKLQANHLNELHYKQMLLSRSPIAIVISALGLPLGLIETAEHNDNG